MSDYILRTNNLMKHYGKTVVLNNLNINIMKGDIYALIGKNGAGKTTLIRIITGLSRKKSGNLQLFGVDDENKFEEMRKNIGVIIETPTLDLDKTAYEILNINRKMKGIKSTSCIKEVLGIVGLEGVRGKKVRNYSLGMKQRLGIAKALIGEPKFLILDEPTNGLDPVGIKDMRELFIKLNKEYDVTILIASHILKELSMIATRYGIINKGVIVEEITPDELMKKYKQFIQLKVDNIEKAEDVLNDKLSDCNYKVKDNNTLELYECDEEITNINKLLVENNIGVKEILNFSEDLESYFTKKVEENINE